MQYVLFIKTICAHTVYTLCAHTVYTIIHFLQNVYKEVRNCSVVYTVCVYVYFMSKKLHVELHAGKG
jgi:hypothetical protein